MPEKFFAILLALHVLFIECVLALIASKSAGQSFLTQIMYQESKQSP